MKTYLDQKIKCGSQFDKTFSEAVKSNRCVAISFLNPFSYSVLMKAKFEQIANDIDFYFSDGALLCKLHSIRYKYIERASFDFSSIAENVLVFAEKNNLPIALIGAKGPEINVANQRLKEIYPELNIMFYRNGYVDDRQKLLEDLDAVKPKLIILGMGTPYQEDMASFLKRNLEFPCVMITCGGFLTQTSIKADYYYPIIKKLGLRWLQRVVMHKHVRDRVLKDYPSFIYKYVTRRTEW
ncbi:teichoic acid biosynthesis protein A [Pseudoalteromonas phenolica]|uniref:Teichoic acid biosynthesis protein A n=1 Tax=Pseudoalteromonas phenolica TaxID=161398 RepID=A0A5R9PWV6_9GAMM|nr:WecB/TagA/CpsF family glycosyltransferase [Pseudoalteromonas phenolica]TLX45311.1 teichoic acid biosynthesis protein A [Pseudoalteromonas phenolica]